MPKRLKHPWLVRIIWVGVIILLLLSPIVGYVSWVRATGISELNRVQKSHALEGIGSKIQDVLLEIQNSNPGNHEQWWLWQQRTAKKETLIFGFFSEWKSDDARKWRLGLSAHPPQALVDAFRPLQEDVSELEKLLDAGPFNAGLAATLKSVIDQSDSDRLMDVFIELRNDGWLDENRKLLHHLDLTVVRFAIKALGYRALTIDTTTGRKQALEQIEKMVQSLSQPISLSESIRFLSALNARDEIYLSAILHQILPNEEFIKWLADDRSDRSPEIIADGFRMMRIYSYGSEDAKQSIMKELRTRMGDDNSLRFEAIMWMYGPGGIALCCDALADVERRMKKGPSYNLDIFQWDTKINNTWIANAVAPNLIQTPTLAADYKFAARLDRVTALIVQHAFSAKIPETTSEVSMLLGSYASWLEPSADQCAMSYTRIMEGRFRVGADIAKSTNGFLTPLERYRSTLEDHAPSADSNAPLHPRTDLPAKRWRIISDMEIWMPNFQNNSSNQ